MAVLTIAKNTAQEYVLPHVATVTVAIQDLDSSKSGRNQAGVFFRDRIRGGANSPRKLQVTFMPMTGNELSTLLKKIGEASFLLTYPDPYEGHDREARFYVGDRTTPMIDYTANAPRWGGLSVNFVEF